jgi:hypothetical protein
MGQHTQSEYNRFSGQSGQNAFAQGANEGSGQFHLPTSPISGAAPVSPAFKGVGRIPEAAPPPPTSPQFDQVRQQTEPTVPGKPPVTYPYNGYAPPPSGANPQQIHQAAMNVNGYSIDGGMVPHMSFAQAKKDSTPVVGKTIRVQNGVTYGGARVRSVAESLYYAVQGSADHCG